MKIASLQLAGFRGIRGELSIEFPAGFAVITGANGTGKSTICDAIEYALLGSVNKYRSAKETGETFEDYLWWRGPGRPESRFVTLVMRSDDGQEILVKRDPSGLHGMDQEKLIDFLCAKSPNGSFGSQNLGQTSIIRGDQVGELSLDLAETERFNFVKTSLGASDLSHVEQKASEASKWFKDQASKLESEYLRIRDAVVHITTEISVATAQISETGDLPAAETSLRSLLGNSTADSTALVSLARAELSSLRNCVQSIPALTHRLTDLERALQQTQTPAHQERVQQMERQLTALRERRSQIVKGAAGLEQRVRQEQQNQPMLESWAQLHEHGGRVGLKDGKCPLCASRVSPEDFAGQLQKIRDDISHQNAALIALVQQRTKLSAELQACGNEIQALERQYQDLVRMSHSLAEEQARIRDELRRILGVSSEVSASPSGLEHEVSKLKERATLLEKNLGLLETSKTLERIAQLRKQLEEHRKQGDLFDAKISKSKMLSERFREAASAIKRVSGELVDERLAELSPLLQEIYSRLRPHVDWTEISYLIRGDVRRFLSLRVGDDLNPKFMFSTGQSRAVGLAFLLAVHLSRSWCLLNSLILDDPVQHIDDYRALHLVEVLHAIRRSGRQIICTVEDQALASLLCRRLHSSAGEDGVMFRMGYVPGAGVIVAQTERFVPSPRISILAA